MGPLVLVGSLVLVGGTVGIVAVIRVVVVVVVVVAGVVVAGALVVARVVGLGLGDAPEVQELPVCTGQELKQSGKEACRRVQQEKSAKGSRCIT